MLEWETIMCKLSVSVAKSAHGSNSRDCRTERGTQSRVFWFDGRAVARRKVRDVESTCITMCYPLPPFLSLSLFGAITRPSQYNYPQHPRRLSQQHSDDRRFTNKVGERARSPFMHLANKVEIPQLESLLHTGTPKSLLSSTRALIGSHS